MKSILRTLALSTPLTVVLSGCTTQELQKFTYNSGASIECRRANDNLPNEAALNQDCLHQSGVDGLSHEEYLKELEKIRNEPEPIASQ